MRPMIELFERTLMARGRAPNTIKAYTGWVERFEAFVGKPLDTVAIEHLEAYQRHLAADRRLEYTTFNQGFCALRSFYGDCLHREWDFRRLPFQKKGRRLPLVMTPEEVEALLGACPNIKHRALLMTGYGGGLRLSEVLALRPEHIDSQRMVIWVVQGKWRKDRKVMLPEQLLLTLREYWREHRPAVWLFEGQEKGRPLSDKTVQTMFQQVRQRAGITKRVTFHSLRHSFATHLLDDGVNVVVIQALLGHRSLSSTQIYTHLAGSYLRETTSPLDRLTRRETRRPLLRESLAWMECRGIDSGVSGSWGSAEGRSRGLFLSPRLVMVQLYRSQLRYEGRRRVLLLHLRQDPRQCHRMPLD